jgi:hypothetical protein
VIEKGNFIDKLIGRVLLGYGLANGVKHMLSRPLLGPWPPLLLLRGGKPQWPVTDRDTASMTYSSVR